KVVTRGWSSARVLAQERFAESAAILDLAVREPQIGDEVTLLRIDDRRGGMRYVRNGWVLSSELQARGELVPPYLQLSRAAGLEEVRRTDWQRRVLAATRWYSRSRRSAWPADRLASVMVALEAVFVEGLSEVKKGETIALRLTERFQMREMTRD